MRNEIQVEFLNKKRSAFCCWCSSGYSTLCRRLDGRTGCLSGRFRPARKQSRASTARAKQSSGRTSALRVRMDVLCKNCTSPASRCLHFFWSSLKRGSSISSAGPNLLLFPSHPLYEAVRICDDKTKAMQKEEWQRKKKLNIYRIDVSIFIQAFFGMT